MKRILLIFGLLAVALPPPAQAWKDALGNLCPNPGAQEVPYNRRVAVILDHNTFPVANTTRATAIRDGLGNFFEMLSLEGGAHVDYYSSHYFSNTTHNSNQGDSLWKVLGNTYPVAILPMATYLTNARFFSACSTNAQLIVCGGGPYSVWRAGAPAACDTSNATSTGSFTYPQGAVTYGANADTLYGMGYGVRRAVLATGIKQVVRLFHPLVMDTSGGTLHSCNVGAYSKAFGSGADTVWAVMPTTMDSVVQSREYMPVAWRVYWTDGGYVDFVCTGTSLGMTGAAWPDILWALASRHVRLDKLRWAYDWDDFTREQSTEARMTKSRLDSILVHLAEYGVRPTIHTDVGHATAYLNGGTPPGETAVTSPYRGSMTALKWWSFHSHDSAAVEPWSGLFGRHSGAVSHRYANSADPNNYGIVQRLVWSDSVRRAVAPGMVVPPYVCPSYNYLLPVDWRTRAALNIHRTGNGRCPPESLFAALRSGIGHSRYAVSVPVYNDVSPNTWHAGNEDTSRIATSPWIYGDERWSIAGCDVRSLSRMEQGSGRLTALSTIHNSANQWANMLLGLQNPHPRGRATAYEFGETFAASPSIARRSVTSRNRIRAIYGHPHSDRVGGWLEVSVLSRGILQRMRALNTLAGHAVWECVEPWRTGRNAQ